MPMQVQIPLKLPGRVSKAHKRDGENETWVLYLQQGVHCADVWMNKNERKSDAEQDMCDQYV